MSEYQIVVLQGLALIVRLLITKDRTAYVDEAEQWSNKLRQMVERFDERRR